MEPKKKRRILMYMTCGVCFDVFGKTDRSVLVYETPKCITGRCRACDTRFFIQGPEAEEFLLGHKALELKEAFESGYQKGSQQGMEMGKVLGSTETLNKMMRKD